ncbi:transcription-repair coupling factor [Nitrogeniibacter mangrovi]|uniref:Transcription-repair-coupling factor n=1 Tax=Nitrogeniibacter mangrovi TaxID=2016596 RepID=A0A6C1B336_9RHOO|nr:transcription-repair coupling factor [Nitrogeniibacter mangrovi]QID17977.1 transcription-repair coupling factor [Nitrogeniibacter mangrovi]
MPHPLLSILDTFAAPRPGQRVDLPRLAGSADALAMAALEHDTMQLVVTANPLDALRLNEELAWFAPELRVCMLPDWETLPYDTLSPHQDLVSERLATLYTITRGEADVVLVPASTALYRLAPPAYLAAHTFFVKRGERLDGEAFRDQMTLAGYAHVTQVVSPGEYSVRGGLIDLFPMGSPLPYRIDLFDDEVDTIRTFDPDTQRTVYPVDQIRLLPAREFPLDETGRTRFRSRFREQFEGDPSRVGVYKDVSNGVAPAGIEYFLPLFFDETATLFDYLPAHSRIVLHGDVPAAIADFWRDTESRHKLLAGDRSRPVLAPSALFLDQEQFFSRAGTHARILIGGTPEAVAAAPVPPIAVERKAADPLHALKTWLNTYEGRVLLLAESPGRRETMAEYFAEYGLTFTPCDGLDAFLESREPVCLSVGPLAAGFLLPEAGLAFLTETELYANTARTPRRRDSRREATVEGWLRDLSELKVGDPVVHVSHGVGRYLGLIHMDLGEGDTEFLHLEYSGGDKLYVPVSQLHVITRYAGADPEAVDLHRLGSGQWEKAKKKAALQVRDTAAELLALYAQRAARAGHRFDFKAHDLDAFAEAFGFEETPDQKAAIDAVVADMKAGRPMDRLVCGDVGFGKTEVALRAAFIAVADGKQVVVLAPTTLLAEQHFQTFSDRFADWPVRIAELSRFRSAKEQAQAIKELAEGKLDIIIGTHRLLQKDVNFKRLGLVIIDEEHRFGVRQKEALKQLRSEVDILTLTATPIPRTLGLAMEGLREFSVIATAPQKRLAIKTFVQRHSKGIVREAVLREFKRGGQVYFLHNEVDTIENMREALTELLPEARIVVGHGQLPERELERVMRDFTQQRANLLLCTTIIETGINIPTANTIIINRADRFGLAQLHQLRGRVGRSHHQAYAYLLTDAHAKPSALAQKRLEAISMMEDLGSGFFLAMHDLEIRGAGEVLGESQSGDIQQIGFSLYTEMLKRAVKDLQAGREPDLSQPLEVVSEINLHAPALLPNAYCADVQERLTLYKRLANAEDEATLRQLQEELIDRFGDMPEQTVALLETHRLRVALKDLDVLKLDAAESQLSIQFGPHAPIEPIKVIELVQKDRNTRMAGQDRLVRSIDAPSVKQRSAAVRTLLKDLGLVSG